VLSFVLILGGVGRGFVEKHKFVCFCFVLFSKSSYIRQLPEVQEISWRLCCAFMAKMRKVDGEFQDQLLNGRKR
jgi:hypothetical protein